MSPTRPLRSIGTGCKFAWVHREAQEEARDLLASDRYSQVQVAVLVDRLERGALTKGTDYKQLVRVEDEPFLYELRVDQARPKLRLYFIEESHDDGVHATGLLLARKPRGSVDEQRRAQNQDIDRASTRRAEA
ncbi:hypothetical protein GCM10010413_42040 [Promicromonospora sukumoe]